MDPIRRTETWFARNGLPQFVASYNAREHIWTRALPAMVVIMVLQLLGAAGTALSRAGRMLPVVGFVVAGLVLLGMGWWSKRRRGYWFAPADRVYWPVFAGFFACGAIAAVPELGRTASWPDLLWALAGQAVLLGVVYLVTRFAVISMLGWGVRQTLRSAGDLYAVATKALPLLLIVMIVLFINTEMWQVAGSLSGPVLWASAGLLLVLGVLVTAQRTSEQIASLDQQAPVEQVRESCAGTPLQGLAAGLSELPEPDLRRPQRRNLLVAAMFTQSVQAALIGALIWLFFIMFGVIAITAPVQEAWMGNLGTADVFWTIGQDHVLSRALLRVSTFLGAFAAFYTTIYASSDPAYRASFSEDVGASLQKAVDVRRVYLAVRDA